MLLRDLVGKLLHKPTITLLNDYCSGPGKIRAQRMQVMFIYCMLSQCTPVTHGKEHVVCTASHWSTDWTQDWQKTTMIERRYWRHVGFMDLFNKFTEKLQIEASIWELQKWTTPEEMLDMHNSTEGFAVHSQTPRIYAFSPQWERFT